MENFSTRDFIVEIVNKLFVYTDSKKWAKLQQEVFSAQVLFDMSSVGGENKTLASKEICDIWQKGFEGIDAVNHLAGNYLVDIQGETATVFAYATATHYKQAATQGHVREFVGTYDIHLTIENGSWKIDQFRYNLKYMNGNIELK
jgi:hypothetical protein